MTLQEYIIRFREDHHLTQRQFAAMCGISSGYMSMIENNMNPRTGKPPVLSVPTIKKLATAMGTTIHELAADLDDEKWSIVDEAVLSEDERDLLMFYRDLDIDNKHLSLSLVKALAK